MLWPRMLAISLLSIATSAIAQESDSSALEPPRIIHAYGSSGETRPHSGYIDPRTEVYLPPSLPSPAGLTHAFIRFNMPVYDCDGSDIGPHNFIMTETGPAAPPQVLNAIYYYPDDQYYVAIRWDRPITLRRWTTLRAELCNAAGVPITNLGNLGPGMNEPDRVDFGFLVLDFTQNGIVNPLDLLRYKQYINGLFVWPPSDLLILDFNRDGVLNPIDLLDLRRACDPPHLPGCGGGSLLNPRP